MHPENGPKVPFAYANFDDCKRYGIKPIPWMWGEYWAKERINHSAEIVGLLEKNKNGFYINTYKKVNQPHPFKNLLISSDSLQFHALFETIPISRLTTIRQRYDHFISWNAFDCLMESERRELIEKMGSLLKPEGTIVLSFRHFFNLSDEALNFFNSDFLRQGNNQYPSHVNVRDIINSRLLRLVSNSNNIDYAYGFNNYDEQNILSQSDILSPFFFSVIDANIYKRIPDAIKKIKNCRVCNVGLFLKRSY